MRSGSRALGGRRLTCGRHGTSARPASSSSVTRPMGRPARRAGEDPGRPAGRAFNASLVRLLSAGPRDNVRHELIRDLGPRACQRHERRSVPPAHTSRSGPRRDLRELSSFTAACWIYPTLLTETPQTVLGTLSPDGSAGWSVLLDRERGVGPGLATGGGVRGVLRAPARRAPWSHVSWSAWTPARPWSGSRRPSAGGRIGREGAGPAAGIRAAKRSRIARPTGESAR